MKSRRTATLVFAVTLLFVPFSGFTQSTGGADASQTSPGAYPGGQHEAMKMVRARATILSTLSAKDSQVGQTFQAKLSRTVQLSNGPQLPSGTMLAGTIETDELQQGMSRLALRFTSATLKDGTVIPVKATIVGVYGPHSQRTDPLGEGSVPIPNSWNDGTLAVDQIGVMSNVDLHSRIASRNSGVFVSTKTDNVTLHSGSEIQLAIAARGSGDGSGGVASISGVDPR